MFTLICLETSAARDSSRLDGPAKKGLEAGERGLCYNHCRGRVTRVGRGCPSVRGLQSEQGEAVEGCSVAQEGQGQGRVATSRAAGQAEEPARTPTRRRPHGRPGPRSTRVTRDDARAGTHGRARWPCPSAASPSHRRCRRGTSRPLRRGARDARPVDAARGEGAAAAAPTAAAAPKPPLVAARVHRGRRPPRDHVLDPRGAARRVLRPDARAEAAAPRHRRRRRGDLRGSQPAELPDGGLPVQGRGGVHRVRRQVPQGPEDRRHLRAARRHRRGREERLQDLRAAALAGRRARAFARSLTVSRAHGPRAGLAHDRGRSWARSVGASGSPSARPSSRTSISLFRFVDGRNHHNNELHSIGVALLAAVAGGARVPPAGAGSAPRARRWPSVSPGRATWCSTTSTSTPARPSGSWRSGRSPTRYFKSPVPLFHGHRAYTRRGRRCGTTPSRGPGSAWSSFRCSWAPGATRDDAWRGLDGTWIREQVRSRSAGVRAGGPAGARVGAG